MGPRARRAARAIERGRPVALAAHGLHDLAVLALCIVAALVGVVLVTAAVVAPDWVTSGRFGRGGALAIGLLMAISCGVIGVPVLLWSLRGRTRTVVLDREGLRLQPRGHLSWSSILGVGVAGEGDRARAWVEVTEAGASAEPYLVADAAELFDLWQVREAPDRAVVLPGDLRIPPEDLAELVRLALAHRRAGA